MVTKAIVSDVSDKYNIKVRIPIYNRASFATQRTVEADLPSATSCVLPNSSLNLRVGDIVYVSFEDDDTGRPVILGCLFKESGNGSTASSISAESINVTATAVLPSETSIGKVTSKEIGFLTGMRENTQYQIDELTKKVNTSGGDIGDLTERVEDLEEDVGTLQDDVSEAQGDISDLQGDVSDLYDGLDDVPVVKSTGTDSAVLKTTDAARTNVASGAFSTAFGSRNSVEASESGAFGGDIHIKSENTYGFGYHVWAWENQNLLGGYDVGSNAKESFIFGNTIGVGCIHDDSTHSWSPSSDHNLSRYIGAVGEKITIGRGCYADFIVGRGHTVGNYVTDSIVAGQNNTLGDEIGWCNVFGDYNIIENYVKEATVFGWDNHVYAGVDVSTKTKNIFLIGHENTHRNRWDDYNYQDIYAFGHGLIGGNDDEIVLGRWNSGLTGEGSGARRVLEVGDGTSTTSGNTTTINRNTCFAIVKQSNNKYKMWLGDVSLTETQLQQLKNLLN